MTLVKKKIRKDTVTQRKRYGNHHRKISTYHKTYWPYLPLIAMFVGSIFFAYQIRNNAYAASSSSQLNKNNFLTTVLVLLIVLGFIVFVLRTYHKVNKLFIKSEKVLLKHYSLDLAIVLLISGLIILVAKY